jgi:hypothetical protein
MALNKEKPVFGSRHAKKLNIGDLVYWVEWIWDPTIKATEKDADPLRSHKSKRFGVISELYVDDRDIRRVAMVKVVPMNSKDNKRIYEKSLIVTSVKLVSKGGYISGKKGNRIISE